VEDALGREIFVRLHGDWRIYQDQAVRDALSNNAMHVWVAEGVGKVVAFVAATLDSARLIGEIWMLAVDPEHQEVGVGTVLTEFATEWLRDSGMQVAMVQTGGDAGHAPARHVYEKSGYTLFPAAQYYKAL
jgi:GNAT superfamily N-acetyltransferase